jgi:hypothetical protein
MSMTPSGGFHGIGRSVAATNYGFRELELYHEAFKLAKDPVFATYVLTGVAAPQVQPENLTASNGSSDHYASEEMPRHLVTLVSEDEIEGD